MGTLIKNCARHPDRKAIGVCVITARAICAECSTQYQGVNYSKEGLEQFLAQQPDNHGRATGRTTHGVGVMSVLAWLLCLPAGWLAWRSVMGFGQLVVDVMQAGSTGGDL